MCESITSTSPPAAIGLEAARRTAPDGVHAVHLGGAAALADHLFRRRRGRLDFDGRDGPGRSVRRGRRIRHARALHSQAHMSNDLIEEL